MMELINNRLRNLRQQMTNYNIDAVIIPSSDPHQSEYVAQHWQERNWISGFTGSAGLAVITQDHAGIWTDSRYYLQAEMETKNSEFVLHKMPDQFAAYYLEYLTENLKKGSKVAVNGWMFSHKDIDQMTSLFHSFDIDLIYNIDLISPIWNDRPPLLKSKVEIHDVLYSGADIPTKLEQIRYKMKKLGVNYHFVSALDDIAWTLNLRGSDVDYNPVNMAYLVIGEIESHLFIDDDKLTLAAQNILKNAHVVLHPYSKIVDYLKTLSSKDSLLVDSSICNQMVYDSLTCQIIDDNSIPKSLKAIKSSVEINHIKNAMVKDAAALANTFYELEQILTSQRSIKENEVADRLAYHRSQQPLYRGESFGAIVGYKSNGAIIHYHADKETCKTIFNEGILLVDSGGQYLDGTTDITRTFSLSTPTHEEKQAYTLILKGMIALSRAIFPKGTMGIQLDILARQYLWSQGMNYGHGTGHGVGFYLNVHEPPQGFTSGLSERGKTPIVPGMLSSNEPGFYKVGAFGMRIENLIVCKESPYNGFLCFDTVTLYPFEHALIDLNLLDADELLWINEYHQKVYNQAASLLSDEVSVWFKEKCKAL